MKEFFLNLQNGNLWGFSPAILSASTWSAFVIQAAEICTSFHLTPWVFCHPSQISQDPLGPKRSVKTQDSFSEYFVLNTMHLLDFIPINSLFAPNYLLPRVFPTDWGGRNTICVLKYRFIWSQGAQLVCRNTDPWALRAHWLLTASCLGHQTSGDLSPLTRLQAEKWKVAPAICAFRSMEKMWRKLFSDGMLVSLLQTVDQIFCCSWVDFHFIEDMELFQLTARPEQQHFMVFALFNY